MDIEDSKKNILRSYKTINKKKVLYYCDLVFNATIEEKINFIFNIIDIKCARLITKDDLESFFKLYFHEDDEEYELNYNSLVEFTLQYFNNNIINQEDFVNKVLENKSLFEIFNIFSDNLNLENFKLDNKIFDYICKIEDISKNFEIFITKKYDPNLIVNINKERVSKCVQNINLLMNKNLELSNKIESSIYINTFLNNNRETKPSKFNPKYNIEKTTFNGIVQKIYVDLKQLKNSLFEYKNTIFLPQDDSKILENFILKSSNKVYIQHKNFPILTSIMKGIHLSSSIIYNTRNKLNFDNSAENIFSIIPPNNNRFNICKFYVVFPEIFFNLRKLFGVSEKQYNESLGLTNLKNFFNNKSMTEIFSDGKSGSFFYYSFDNKFFVKTIKKSEYKFCIKNLKSYFAYFNHNPYSLLSKYYGLYKIKLLNKNKKYKVLFIIVMDNIFINSHKIDEKYDLKGSFYKRYNKDFETKDPSKITKKEGDLKAESRIFKISKDIYDNIIEQIHRDSCYLKKINAIDYSLIIGIDIINKKNGEQFTDKYLYKNMIDTEDINLSLISRFDSISEIQNIIKNREGIKSVCGNYYYYIGIIDTLTCYNAIKKCEFITKCIFQGRDVSCQPPSKYSNRFINYINKIITFN